MRNCPSFIPAPALPTFTPSRPFSPKRKAFKWARVIKFFTGWNSHLYYWIYTGLMVGVTAILAGWLAGQFMPDTFSGTYNSPLFMWLFCVVFSLGVGYIAYRGVNGTTAVNMAINVIQICALVVFAIMAIAYRSSHPDGSVGWHLSNGTPSQLQCGSRECYWTTRASRCRTPGRTTRPRWMTRPNNPSGSNRTAQVAKDDLDKAKNTNAVDLAGLTAMGLGEGDPYPAWKQDDKGNVVVDKDGKPTADPFILSYKPADAVSGSGTAKDPTTFNFHTSAASVVVATWIRFGPDSGVRGDSAAGGF